MIYNSPEVATVLLHEQGVGGNFQRLVSPLPKTESSGAQRGPGRLLAHGLLGKVYEAGFSRVEEDSLWLNYPGLDNAEGIGNRLGERLGFDRSLRGAHLLGFPFKQRDPYKTPGKGLSVVEKFLPQFAASVVLPLAEAINNIERLRRYHRVDYLKCMNALANGSFLIHLSGTHDGDIGAVAAVSAYHNLMGQKVGLVSFDAHGDYNTFRISPSGNLHGMHNAIATMRHMRSERYLAFLGSQNLKRPLRKICPANLLHVGGRAFDPLEAMLMRRDRVNILSMPMIEYARRQKTLEDVFASHYHEAMIGTDVVIVSIDWDVLDPDSISSGRLAVSCQEEQGLYPEDLETMLGIIAKGRKPVAAILCSELNPHSGPDTNEESFDLAVRIMGDFFKNML